MTVILIRNRYSAEDGIHTCSIYNNIREKYSAVLPSKILVKKVTRIPILLIIKAALEMGLFEVCRRKNDVLHPQCCLYNATDKGLHLDTTEIFPYNITATLHDLYRSEDQPTHAQRQSSYVQQQITIPSLPTPPSSSSSSSKIDLDDAQVEVEADSGSEEESNIVQAATLKQLKKEEKEKEKFKKNESLKALKIRKRKEEDEEKRKEEEREKEREKGRERYKADKERHSSVMTRRLSNPEGKERINYTELEVEVEDDSDSSDLSDAHYFGSSVVKCDVLFFLHNALGCRIVLEAIRVSPSLTRIVKVLVFERLFSVLC